MCVPCKILSWCLKSLTESSRARTLDRPPSTVLTLQGCSPVGFPHHGVLQTHGPTTTLLLRLVTVDVAHTHPAARPGAHRPLGVVLAGLEGEDVARVEERDVQDLPAPRAVGRQDSCGADPELDQEVGLEGGGHPGVVQV